ncbi:hypothetical protein ACU5AX_18400 [Sphingomonas sp. XXL09]|uniref:hypothetical protein n=1 Tax=Sphingomonas sp. XXL09 TaxID=3457787 RepID=UPI00406BD6AD
MTKAVEIDRPKVSEARRSDVQADEPPIRPRIGLSLTALAAGLINLVGGGAVLKAWIFNAGQTYYDALFRAFWLPEGVIGLSDSVVTAAGYRVLRDNTELWVLIIIYGIPLVITIAFAALAFEWALERTLGRKLPLVYKRIKKAGDVFGRIYLIISLVLVIPWLVGMLWAGVYRYPKVASDAGKAKHAEIKALIKNNCSACPRWGNGVKGVAIVANGQTALIATERGVMSIDVKSLNQRLDDTPDSGKQR